MTYYADRTTILVKRETLKSLLQIKIDEDQKSLDGVINILVKKYKGEKK